VGAGVNRRPLQVVTGLLGIIPVTTGVLTMMGLNDPIYAAADLPAHALAESADGVRQPVCRSQRNCSRFARPPMVKR
jgi:hypothetical protein